MRQSHFVEKGRSTGGEEGREKDEKVGRQDTERESKREIKIHDSSLALRKTRHRKAWLTREERIGNHCEINAPKTEI